MMEIEDSQNNQLSKEELALYDRQIRLWGMESQNRLRNLKVLVFGSNGLGAEIGKNLVLAGIKSLTIVDPQDVTESDLYDNYFLSRDNLNQNRGQSGLARIKLLNPKVEVTALIKDPTIEEPDTISNYHIVCACTSSLSELTRLNDLCRSKNIKFMAGYTYGLFGYCFVDLITYTYSEVIAKSQTNACIDIGDNDVGDSNGKDAEIKLEEETVQRTLDYVPLQTTLQLKCARKSGRGLDKKLTPHFYLLHVLYKFQEEQGRDPSLADHDNDIVLLQKLRDTVIEFLGIEESRFPESYLEFAFGRFSSVASILGGIMAQEQIKVISQQEKAFRNFFFFDGDECGGIVECIANCK